MRYFPNVAACIRIGVLYLTASSTADAVVSAEPGSVVAAHPLADHRPVLRDRRRDLRLTDAVQVVQAPVEPFPREPRLSGTGGALLALRFGVLLPGESESAAPFNRRSSVAGVSQKRARHARRASPDLSVYRGLAPRASTRRRFLCASPGAGRALAADP